MKESIIKNFFDEYKIFNKRILLILFFIVTICLTIFYSIQHAVVFVIIITIYSLLDQLFIPEYPLSASRILAYTISIILLVGMLLLSLSGKNICKQLLKCKEVILLHEDDNNISNYLLIEIRHIDIKETNGTK